MNEYILKKNYETADKYGKLKAKHHEEFTIYTDKYFGNEEISLYNEDKKNNICLLLAVSSKSVTEIINGTDFKHYFVIYPSEQVYYNNFVSYNMTDLLKNKKYKPIVSDDNLQSYIFANLEAYRFSMVGTSFIILNKNEWETKHNETLISVLNSIIYFINQEKLNINTNHFLSKKQTFNQYKNLQKTLEYPTVEILKNKLEGKPCICVGAGGSLAKNISYLKKIQKKVFIICCINVLKPLIANGIKPDLVTSLDSSILMTEFCSNCNCKDLMFVNDVSSYHKLTYFFNKNIISLSSIAHKKELINYYKSIGVNTEDAGEIKTPFSVAFFNVSLASYMGAIDIILVGQDLACEYDNTHIDGYAFNQKFDKNRWNIPVKSWSGKGISFTDITFKIYREFFELSIPQYKANIYNCTEGGAYIAGCKHITLKEADKLLIKDNKKTHIEYKNDEIKYSFDELKRNISISIVSIKSGLDYIKMYREEKNVSIKKSLAIKINKIKDEIINNKFILGVATEQRNSLYDMYVYMQTQRKNNNDVVLEMYVLFTHFVNVLSLLLQSFIVDDIQTKD
jgi:hypothetical protein